MNKIKKFLKSVSDFRTKCFGRKYYVVIARNRFSLHEYCVGHIFDSWETAANFSHDLQYNTRGEVGLEVHSFRSHRLLDTFTYYED